MVRGVVERPRDGRVVGEARVLALHGRRVLGAIAPVVVASWVSETQRPWGPVVSDSKENRPV